MSRCRNLRIGYLASRGRHHWQFLCCPPLCYSPCRALLSVTAERPCSLCRLYSSTRLGPGLLVGGSGRLDDLGQAGTGHSVSPCSPVSSRSLGDCVFHSARSRSRLLFLPVVQVCWVPAAATLWAVSSLVLGFSALLFPVHKTLVLSSPHKKKVSIVFCFLSYPWLRCAEYRDRVHLFWKYLREKGINLSLMKRTKLKFQQNCLFNPYFTFRKSVPTFDNA